MFLGFDKISKDMFPFGLLTNEDLLNSQQSSIPSALFLVVSSGRTSLSIFHVGFVKKTHFW